MMIDTPETVRTARQDAAVIRIKVPRSQIRQVMGPAMREVVAAVTSQGIGPAGPLYTHHFGIYPDVFEYEVGVPVNSPVSPVGRVQPGEVPALEIARTVYHGSYEHLATAWQEFDDWIGRSGHVPAADLWERYLTQPHTTADPDSETELSRA